ncbi:phage tail protein [Magnetospirillum fulvum]|uniref:Microcystin-dependent protein n=1 Tax=Magnetospirillum fulvum TaxID=1082 RepID=A0A1H6H975_MAGFU|nr:tail fiber protein [Magnetospirillum fulvum]SEH30658.1 Microcystin-dependent protein [Magnetospirillum fulvum]
MSDEFVGEIRLFPYFRGAPLNWAVCNGQTLNISDNTQLFSLIGTTYGGNGTTNFALPNLNGRLPVGKGQLTGGSNYTLGQSGGIDAISLTPAQGVAHDHAFRVSSTVATQPGPASTVLFSALADPTKRFAVPTTTNPTYSALAESALTDEGGSAAHNNVMPSICILYCICLNGVYPQQN